MLNYQALIAGITSLSQIIIHIAQLRAGSRRFKSASFTYGTQISLKFGNILLGVMVMIILLAIIVQKHYRVKVVRLVVFFNT